LKYSITDDLGGFSSGGYKLLAFHTKQLHSFLDILRDGAAQSLVNDGHAQLTVNQKKQQ